MRLLVAIGTRPEAIKFAPLVMELRKRAIEVAVYLSGQNSLLALQALEQFNIVPDYHLPGVYKGAGLTESAAIFMQQAEGVILEYKPDLVLVQGDTTTAFAVALAAYYNRYPVAHLEAGLRTYNAFSPFPEENNRRMISVLASLHFAPCETSYAALIKENISKDSIYLTGNTIIDALKLILEKSSESDVKPLLSSQYKAPYILVTAHRRENFDGLHQQYFTELNVLAERLPHVQFVFVRHSNPFIATLSEKMLLSRNISIIESLKYSDFVCLMRGSEFIITDSGGIQEESAFLGKPTLLIRETTERKELLSKANMILVGAESGRLTSEVLRLLEDREYYQLYSKVSTLYGIGNASVCIVDAIVRWKSLSSKNVRIDVKK